MADPVASNDLYTVVAGSVSKLAQVFDLRSYGFGFLDNSLLKNDLDSDFDTLQIVSLGPAALVDGSATAAGDNGGLFTVLENGTLTFDASSGFEYLAAGELATTKIAYTVSDGNGGFSSAEIIITVTGIDGDAVIAIDDTYLTDSKTVVNTTISEVLASDWSYDGSHVYVKTNGVDVQAGVASSFAGSHGGLFQSDGYGNLSFNPNGDFDQFGEGQSITTSLEYTIRAANGEESTGRISIVVSGIDDAPIAINDSYSVQAGGDYSVAYERYFNYYRVDTTLLKNDSDPEGGLLAIVDVDGNPLTGGVVVVQGSQGGSFTITSKGEMSFDGTSGFESLRAGESVDTSVTYGVSDGNGNIAYANAVVSVQGQDGDAVLATKDTYYTDQNNAVSTSISEILSGDWSHDGLHSFALVNGQSVSPGAPFSFFGSNGGLFSSTGSGEFVFDPNGEFDFLGEGETALTSITYTIEASNGETATATAEVVVSGINDAPIVTSESFNLAAGEAKSFTNYIQVGAYSLDTRLLANDRDPESEPLKIVSVNGESMVDGAVSVAGTNGAIFNVSEDGDLSVDASSGFEYLMDSETLETTAYYTVEDESGEQTQAQVVITINGVDGDGALATSDIFYTDQNSSVSTTVAEVLDGDWAFDGNPIYYQVNGVDVEYGVAASFAGSNGGRFSGDGFGNLIFEPLGDFDYLQSGQTAISTIDYTIRASNGETSTAAVQVVVSGLNDAPTVAGELFSIVSGDAKLLANQFFVQGFEIDRRLLVNDSDVDGDSISIVSVEGAAMNGESIAVIGSAGGTFEVSPDGTMSFDATTGFEYLRLNESVESSVAYIVSDGLGGMTEAIASVRVEGRDGDAVAAVDLTFTISENAGAVNGASGQDFLDAGWSYDGGHVFLSADGHPPIPYQPVDWSNGGFSWADEFGNAWFDTNEDFDYLSEGETAFTSSNYYLMATNGEVSQAKFVVEVLGENDAPTLTGEQLTIRAGESQTLGELRTVQNYSLDSRLLYNDRDAEGDDLRIIEVDGQALVNGSISISGSAGGTFLVSELGDVSFDASTGFENLRAGEFANSSVIYTVSDGEGGLSSATVTVSVQGVDGDAIIASDDLYSTDENTTFTLSSVTEFWVNDWSYNGAMYFTDENGVPTPVGTEIINIGDNGGLFIVGVDGSATFDPNGEFDYLADGESITTSITYHIMADNGETASAQIGVEVNGVGPSITANPDYFTTDAVTPFSEHGTVLFANDSSFDGQMTYIATNGELLTYGVPHQATGNQGGLFIGDGYGMATFDPNGDFAHLRQGESAMTSVTYTIQASNGDTATSTINIDVSGVDGDAIIANDDLYSTDENTTFTLSSVAEFWVNDWSYNGAMYFTDENGVPSPAGTEIINIGDNGGLFIVGVDGSATFDPNGEFDYLADGESITTSITYHIMSDNGEMASAQIGVEVVGAADEVNTPVSALDDYYSVSENLDPQDYIEFNPSDNDVDPDAGDSISTLSFWGTKGGWMGGGYGPDSNSIRYNPGAEFEYLAEGETETVSFEYTAISTDGTTDTATAYITVTGQNDNPRIAADLYTVDSDSTLTINISDIMANDSDVDNGAVLSFGDFFLNQTAGTVVDNGDGTLTYDPNGMFDELTLVDEPVYDIFNYTISDEHGAVSWGAVNISVQGVQSVVAADDTFLTREFTKLDFLANDLDLSGTDDLKITNIDLSSSKLRYIYVTADYGEAAVSYDLLYSEVPHHAEQKASFDYTVENALGHISVATVEVSNVNMLTAVGRGEQSVQHVSMKSNESFVLDVNQILTGQSAVDFTLDSSYNEGNWVNGVYHTPTVNDGYYVNNGWGGSVWVPASYYEANLVDIGSGLYEVSFTDGDSGNDTDFTQLRFVDPAGHVFTVRVDFTSYVQSVDLITGSNTLVAQNDLLEMNVGLNSNGMSVLVNDVGGLGLQVVAMDVIGASNVNSVFNKVDISQSGQVSVQWGLGAEELDEGEVSSTVLNYTVVDDAGNYDTAALTINAIGQQDAPRGSAPYVLIDEDVTLTFDEDFLINSVYDPDNGRHSYGQGVSVVSVDSASTLGSLAYNAADDTYTYDPTVAFDHLASTDAPQRDSIDITYADADGTEAHLTMLIDVVGLDDPVV